MLNPPFNKELYPNCHEGHQYALDILSGDIVANIWVKAACQRYLNDLQRIETDPKCPFFFLPEKAEKYLRVVQKFHHVKGRWDTKEIIYMPWQKFIFLNIMGFQSHVTGERRFRTAHIDIARGAGKSAVASQAALYFLCLDNPVGNEVYCAASKKDQARLVLDSSRAMAKANDSFLKSKGVKVRAHDIIHASSNSFIKALSSNADSQDGLSAALIITDELHAMSKSMFDVLDSGQSKRRDSLLLSITTAGTTTETAGYSQRSYAKKVALGEVKDETFFSLVYCIDEEDEKTWWDESCWIKANPGLFKINDITNLRAKCDKAKVSPSDKPNFLCKHLNLYQNSMNQYFNVTEWNNCRDAGLTLDQLRGKKCYAAVDLSSKNDITSFGFVFNIDGEYVLYNINFCPQDAIDKSSNKNFQDYVAEGSLIPTPGAAINYDVLEDEMLKYKKMFNIIECFFDSWQANQFALNMQAKGINMTEMRMNVSNLSEPTKVLEASSRSKKIRHFGTKILSWMIGNIVCKEDAARNIFPRKEHEKNKIDGAMTIIMALAGWVNETGPETSVYETRGIRSV